MFRSFALKPALAVDGVCVPPANEVKEKGVGRGQGRLASVDSRVITFPRDLDLRAILARKKPKR